MRITRNEHVGKNSLDQGGLEGLPTILRVAFILSKFLRTLKKTSHCQFHRGRIRNGADVLVTIERKVVYRHSFDLGACS